MLSDFTDEERRLTKLNPYYKQSDEFQEDSIAHWIAIDAYTADDPIAEAERALSISPVPEAFNVQAVKGAKTFQQVSYTVGSRYNAVVGGQVKRERVIVNPR